MITPRLPVALAVAAGALAAGCGASDPAAGVAQVKQTVHAALADLASGDGRAFCALASPAERTRLRRALARTSCAQAADVIGADLSPAHRAELRHAVVTKVTINGATATVSAADITTTSRAGSLTGFLSDRGHPTTLARRPDGRWVIDG